ncbi:MAG: hypothetical protein HY885_18100 [Deltaproteobacteria bacterium]|nr:hypothetical protein [Deltaproteobacteria bacterium]
MSRPDGNGNTAHVMLKAKQDPAGMHAGTHYNGLVVAGFGAIGQGLFAIGDSCLRSFADILVIDRELTRAENLLPAGARFIRGDIRDNDWLMDQLNTLASPVLFVNLCSGVDNVMIRRLLGKAGIAYLDSCCCAPEGSTEARFSRMMPYTMTKIASSRPQWLCWGINPGLVELMTRKIIAGFDPGEGNFEITIFEHDQLEGENGVIVGWCPEALIEEIMRSPTLECSAGQLLEKTGLGAGKVLACWGGQPVASRVVAHEDIWNIGRLPGVLKARFIYGLHPGVMRILGQDISQARILLKTPGRGEPVFGAERLAVSVKSGVSGRERVLIWQENHHDIWQRHGINAVQYQTGKALLLALRLLQLTSLGELAGQYCAADLPLTGQDWGAIDLFMHDLAINWRDAKDLDLRLCPRAESGGGPTQLPCPCGAATFTKEAAPCPCC